MRQERRRFPRYAVRKDVTATLKVNGEEDRLTTPANISCGGVLLPINDAKPGPAKVVFSVPQPFGDGPFEIAVDCTVLPTRPNPAGGCAIQFLQPLSGETLARFAAD